MLSVLTLYAAPRASLLPLPLPRTCARCLTCSTSISGGFVYDVTHLFCFLKPGANGGVLGSLREENAEPEFFDIST